MRSGVSNLSFTVRANVSKSISLSLQRAKWNWLAGSQSIVEEAFFLSSSYVSDWSQWSLNKAYVRSKLSRVEPPYRSEFPVYALRRFDKFPRLLQKSTVLLHHDSSYASALVLIASWGASLCVLDDLGKLSFFSCGLVTTGCKDKPTLLSVHGRWESSLGHRRSSIATQRSASEMRVLVFSVRRLFSIKGNLSIFVAWLKKSV